MNDAYLQDALAIVDALSNEEIIEGLREHGIEVVRRSSSSVSGGEMPELPPLPESQFCAWVQHGKVVNAFMHGVGDKSRWDHDGHWAAKGYDRAPLFTAEQYREGQRQAYAHGRGTAVRDYVNLSDAATKAAAPADAPTFDSTVQKVHIAEDAREEVPPLPEPVGLSELEYAQRTPEAWDHDYRSTWQKLQVALANNRQWRAYAKQLREQLTRRASSVPAIPGARREMEQVVYVYGIDGSMIQKGTQFGYGPPGEYVRAAPAHPGEQGDAA